MEYYFCFHYFRLINFPKFNSLNHGLKFIFRELKPRIVTAL